MSVWFHPIERRAACRLGLLSMCLFWSATPWLVAEQTRYADGRKFFPRSRLLQGGRGNQSNPLFEGCGAPGTAATGYLVVARHGPGTVSGFSCRGGHSRKGPEPAATKRGFALPSGPCV